MMPEPQTAEQQPANPAPKEPEDPFAGFESKEFQNGEEVAASAPKSTTAAKPEKPANEPAGNQDGAQGSDSPENPAGDADEVDGEGKPDGEQRRPKGTYQERINELTRKQREAERREEAERQRAERLERELAEIRAGKAPAGPAKPDAGEKPADDRPDPEQYKFGELDPDYIEALAQHATRKALAEIRQEEERARQQAEAQQRQQTEQERFERIVQVGSSLQEDFYEKVVAGAHRGDYPLSPEMAAMVLESDHGAEILYHLATNPEDSSKVIAMSPREQARFFVTLEDRFSAARSAANGDGQGDSPAGTPQQAATVRIPRAPAPVTPARGGGGPRPVSANSDNFAEFERLANGK